MSNAKYCTTQDHSAFNWKRFLNKKKHTVDDVDQACSLAGDWVTCACGNTCAIIPRDEHGAPFDKQLKKQGREFAFAVCSMYAGQSCYRRTGNKDYIESYNHAKRRATDILHKIEKRSTVLIHRIRKEGRKKSGKVVKKKT